MPHNYKDYEVIQVAFPRNSTVLARLKEEALRYKGKPNAGPHIYELLVDRDAHLYGEAEGNGKGIWFPATVQVITTVAPEQTQASAELEPLTVVTESDPALIEKQAADMAAAFADDDDE